MGIREGEKAWAVMESQNFRSLKVWQLGMQLVGRSLPAVAAVSEAGNVWPEQPDSARRGFHSRQHRRGARHGLEQGLLAVLAIGSARAAAVAFNRDPDLMRSKTRRIHLCWRLLARLHGMERRSRSQRDRPPAAQRSANRGLPRRQQGRREERKDRKQRGV